MIIIIIIKRAQSFFWDHIDHTSGRYMPLVRESLRLSFSPCPSRNDSLTYSVHWCSYTALDVGGLSVGTRLCKVITDNAAMTASATTTETATQAWVLDNSRLFVTNIEWVSQICNTHHCLMHTLLTVKGVLLEAKSNPGSEECYYYRLI